ncbi:UNVERIFIED_CONTAM: hypothetical protein NY603_20585, partial [Bacteroidetes bacterium 56_B9]
HIEAQRHAAEHIQRVQGGAGADDLAVLIAAQGVAAASRRCSVRCGAAGSGAADCSGCGPLGGRPGAGRSKTSIGSKSAVGSAARVGGVRRRSENRT